MKRPLKLALQRALSGVASFTVTYLAARVVQNAYRFEVTRHRRALPKLNQPLRVVHLSDFHTGPFVGYAAVREWVDAANAQQPDLIVATGDFVDHWFGRSLEELERTLLDLRAPLGVWGVWGNHDHARFADLRGLESALNRAGVHILNNRGVKLRSDLYLAGVDDAQRGAPDIVSALRNRPEDAACLLLAHNPDFIPDVPQEVNLTLCGHTHGGQVRLPGWGPVFTSSAHGQRFASGWVEERALPLAYVSRGLGTVIFPARLRCPAELAVFDLLPAR